MKKNSANVSKINGCAGAVGILGIIYILVIFLLMSILEREKFFSIFYVLRFDDTILVIAITMVMVLILRHGDSMTKCVLNNCRSFDKFIERFDEIMFANKFQCLDTMNIDSQGIIMYYGKDTRSIHDIVSVVHVHDLNKNNAVLIDNLFLEFITRYYRQEWSKGNVDLLFMICVDKDSPEMLTFVSTNVRQRLRVRYLPIGITFEDGLIHTEKPKKMIPHYLIAKRKTINLLKRI